MKALIAIHPQSINNKPIPTVSARELHKFLEVGRDFSTWINDRIEEFGYEPGRDFIAITGSPNSGIGEFNPKPPIEYHLTLDMAKELAMIERNTMGRVARKYFIRCEQAALEHLPAMRQALLALNPRWQKILDYRLKGLNNIEIGLLVGLHRRTITREFQAMTACGLDVGTNPAGIRRSPAKTISVRPRKWSGSNAQLQLFPVGALR